jgi:ATP-dependent DNA helicase DinG
VVVATATLALQHQLVERDLPRLVEAVASMPGGSDVDTSFAVQKGRANYACLHRIREGVPDDQGALVEVPEGTLGKEVLELREWAESCLADDRIADRDAAPSHADRAWRQISVSHRECIGATRCPFSAECFAERARAEAHDAQIVVTNHAMLAIDAIEGVPMLPEYDAVIVDEAHELTARVTQAATANLDPALVERAARRARSHVKEGLASAADDLADASDALAEAYARTDPGRIDRVSDFLGQALALVRDSARAVLSAFASDTEVDAGRQQAKGAVDELRLIAERMLLAGDGAVLWLSDNKGNRRLHVAPMDVSGQLRDKLFAAKTVVLTSATLKLGGTFEAIARELGLAGDESWTGLDVGSPFDYRRQAILYVAKHLPPPGRDGLVEEQLAEIAELVESAGGRTLGLFSSRRAAEQAAAEMRSRLPDLEILCQGESQLSSLAQKFAETPATCLFGTLSLWQGMDLPGETCQLVIIDRLPFPRPDDPVLSARQRLAEQHGHNGFMTVAATQAALLLAQGVGRLIRRSEDRGVVAVLDPRLVTARYGSFLAASLPPMWRTTDPVVAREALRRLAVGK